MKWLPASPYAGTIGRFIIRYFDSAVIVLLGLAPLCWFDAGCLIAGGDFSFFLNPLKYVSLFLYPWSPAALGGANVTFSTSLVYYVAFGVLKQIGCGPILSQKLWLVFFVVSAGLSMRYFVRTVTGAGSPAQRVCALVSAALYMANFYVFNTKTFMLSSNTLYAFTPLFMSLIYRAVVGERNNLRHVLCAACLTILLAPAAVNPPNFAVFLFLQGSFLAFTLVASGRKACYTRALKYGLIFALLAAALHIWWILPYYSLLFRYMGFTSYQHVYWNPGSFLKDTMALGGCWSWGDYYNPIAFPVYQLPLVKLCLYLVPFAAFSGLLVRGPGRRTAYYCVALAFFGVFMSKGRGGLLGDLYVFLFEHCPGFWMFREPYTKFGFIAVFAYSFLAGYAVSAFYEKVRFSWRRFSYLVPALALCVICVAGWPIFTRWYASQGGAYSFQVKIPPYWNEAADYINGKEGDFRLFELPDNKSAYTFLGWQDGFSGTVPEQCFFRKPAVTSNLRHQPIVQYLYSLVGDEDAFFSPLLFGLFNVSRVYQRNDAAWQTMRTMSPPQVKCLLEDKLGLRREASFGAIDFYLTGAGPNPVYLQDACTFVVGGFQALPALSYTDLIARPAFIFDGLTEAGQLSQAEKRCGRVVYFQDDSLDWDMRFLSPDCRYEPETQIGWKDHDYKNGWVSRSNFFPGEWLKESEQRSVNGSFFFGAGAVYTEGREPLSFVRMLPRDGEYNIVFRGTALDYEGKVTLVLDGEKIDARTVPSAPPRLAWCAVGRKVPKGAHTIEVRSETGRALIDSFAFFSENDLLESRRNGAGLIKDKELVILLSLDGRNAPSRQFHVPKAGSFEISACSIGNGSGAASVAIDGTTFDYKRGGAGFKTLGKMSIDAGLHTVEAKPPEGRLILKLSDGTARAQGRVDSLTIRRLGPSRLLIDQLKLDAPQVLVFSEMYHQGWKAYALDKPRDFYTGLLSIFNIFIRRADFREIKEHYMVNGYANAFYLPAAGRYTILLEFDPQNWFDRGIALSLAAGLVCLCLLWVIFIKRK